MRRLLVTSGLIALALVLWTLAEGCELHNPAPTPIDPPYPPMACPQTRCKPPISIDRSSPWDAGPG